MEPPGGPVLMFPMPGCSVSRQDASKSWAPGSGAGGGGSSASRGFGGGGAGGEVDEETKKNQNIINIVREGQISLLVSGRNPDHSETFANHICCYIHLFFRLLLMLILFPFLLCICLLLTSFPCSLTLPLFIYLLLQPHLAADNLELIRDEDGNNLLHISACQGHADCLQHLTSLMGEDSLNERNNQQLTPAGLGVKVCVCVCVCVCVYVCVCVMCFLKLCGKLSIWTKNIFLLE